MPAVIRLNPAECALLLVDLQEKLVPVVDPDEACVARADLLALGARKLGVPVLATEQYPVIDWLHKDARRTVILAGMETHICLAQTALDLIEADFSVAVAVDACAARNGIDHQIGCGRMFHAKAVPVTAEAVLFEWLGDASSPVFKEISLLVRQSRAALGNIGI